MLAPFFDDELRLLEELAGLDAEGDALCIQKVEDGGLVQLSCATAPVQRTQMRSTSSDRGKGEVETPFPIRLCEVIAQTEPASAID
eukprot:1051597-Amphidinium_carterae.1